MLDMQVKALFEVNRIMSKETGPTKYLVKEDTYSIFQQGMDKALMGDLSSAKVACEKLKYLDRRLEQKLRIIIATQRQNRQK